MAAAGTRALVEVLLLHRHLDRVDVIARITTTLSVGSTSPDVVALAARKAAEGRGAMASPNWGGHVVILAEHLLASVPTDTRPLPSVDQYDILLGQETS